MIAYAIGLHLGVRPTRWGVVGLAFLVLSGVGLVWAGYFPQQMQPAPDGTIGSCTSCSFL
jgi:drug/metabolite transporter (DMT)-like permease